MDPARSEYLVEEEPITIIPRFKMRAFSLIDQELGPFMPNVPIDVPLWLAIQLKQQQKCRIMQPQWLAVDELKEVKEKEETDTGCSDPPNPHYIEMATLLLQHAPDDITSSETVRTLIKDIWDLRSRKFVYSVHGFVSSQVASARVSQLTGLELTGVRGVLVNGLDQLAVLRAASANASAGSSTTRSQAEQSSTSLSLA